MNHPSEHHVCALWEEGVWGPPPRVGANCWTSYRLTLHHSGCSAQQQQQQKCPHTLFGWDGLNLREKLGLEQVLGYVLQVYQMSTHHPKQARSLFGGGEGR